MPLTFVPLERAFLRVSGEDARAFLQGLVSNDMHKLTPRHPLYALLLTPQGKFLQDFFLLEREGAVLIDCERARAQELLRRLSMYKLRSRVTLEALPEAALAVYALFGEGAESLAGPQACADPRLKEMGLRATGAPEALAAWAEAAGAKAGDKAAYEAWRIGCGVPSGEADLVPEKSLPLDYGLDKLHAIDYAKGCYVGQEVTARMHWRANLRKKLYIVAAQQLLPAAGTAVTAGEKIIGELRSSAGGRGLALLNVEEWQSAGAALAGGVALTADSPAWNRD